MLLSKVKNLVNRVFRYSINYNLRKKIKNKDFTLISSNCNGAFILHDLGLKFNSPFVNLYILPKDFIKFLSNIEYYCQQKLDFTVNLSDTLIKYPVAKLDDITIYFMHYKNEKEAKEKWYQRLERANLKNLFIMMTDRDGCTYQDLVNFDNLPFNNKIVFTHKYYPELSSSYYIKGFENEVEVGNLFEYYGFFGKKYYDQFNYLDWFNKAIMNN